MLKPNILFAHLVFLSVIPTPYFRPLDLDLCPLVGLLTSVCRCLPSLQADMLILLPLYTVLQLSTSISFSFFSLKSHPQPPILSYLSLLSILSFAFGIKTLFFIIHLLFAVLFEFCLLTSSLLEKPG